MKTDAPLRILMILHMPWSRNVGGARVQFELAEQYERMGHHVDKFDITDSIPSGIRPFLKLKKMGRIFRLLIPRFSTAACRHVQAHGTRYDVIDAHHGDLPFSKEHLGFKGTLVCRSVGLIQYYNAFAEQERKTSQAPSRSKLLGLFEKLEVKKGISNQDADISFREADVILVPTSFESGHLRQSLPTAPIATILPFGLTEKVLSDFQNAISLRQRAPAPPTVAFVGSWERRKGREDWPRIVRKVRSLNPATKFLFLGTIASEEAILQAFDKQDRSSVRAIPRYANQQTAELLSTASVGAFPSYLEGFAFGALELVAAGLPVIGYDIPSLASLVTDPRVGSLVPCGDADSLATHIVKRLQRTEAQAQDETAFCHEYARTFNLPDLAAKNIEAYRSARH